MRALLASIIFWAAFVRADEESIDILSELKGQHLFVSLGSSCDPALWLRGCGLRAAAFPFDWLLSIDGDRFAEVIETDFQGFLDGQNFAYFNGAIVHTLYHIEFRHEHGGMAEIFEKYPRRIGRFKDLDGYPGKVVFIRAPYIEATNPTLYWPNEAGLRITLENALALRDALKKLLPHADFTLLIVNHEGPDAIEYRDNIILATRARADIEGIQKIIQAIADGAL